MNVGSLPLRGVDLGLKFVNLFCNEIHWSLAEKFYRQVGQRDVDTYETQINPFEVHFVSPNEITEITRRTVSFSSNRWELLGSVCGGNWDQREEFVFSNKYQKTEWFNKNFCSIYLDQCLFYRSMIERYQNGKDWFETDYIEAVLDEIEKGNSVWHSCTNREDVKKQCNYVDALYEKIKTEGYKTQREMGRDFKTAITNEVIIDIGRDGKLLFVDGRHRLAIAKLLNLDTIPVAVAVRHEDWINSNVGEFK